MMPDDRKTMLSLGQFVMFILTPFVAVLIFIAWPVTIAVGALILIGLSLKVFSRK